MNDTIAHPTVNDARAATVKAVLFDDEKDTTPEPWEGPLGHLLGTGHEVRESGGVGRPRRGPALRRLRPVDGGVGGGVDHHVRAVRLDRRRQRSGLGKIDLGPGGKKQLDILGTARARGETSRNLPVAAGNEQLHRAWPRRSPA